MGCPCCEVCGKMLGFTDTLHVCDPQQIMKRYDDLHNELWEASHKLELMKNAVQMLLSELPTLEPAEITISTKWLQRLWEATNGRFYQSKTVEDFLSRWFVTHHVLCEAYGVFKSKKGENLLQKLKNLHLACFNSKPVLGYEDSKFDRTPEQLMEEELTP